MISAAELPMFFWMHALKMAVYVQNRSYPQTLNAIPYHMMNGMTRGMHRIKKFGSIAYVHKPTGPSRKKLDDKYRIGFLVGYLEGQAGYQVNYSRELQHVEHVTINEEIVYQDRYDDEKSTTVEDWAFQIEKQPSKKTMKKEIMDM
ncbi:LOW QUALITY PROTEIN: hypothetical protein PHMEG_00013666 [Phytophthora megakarya]|uniref:Retroviral polymerase SH3-like domain-containing protein n=1 Tax=Phytophthora megakarya TaxID=4795 RepID=A0A225W7U8_9STRA|nr:LOW QUALITY PROTEIN: hypothetical protein PHMEG_00013666 [Phytophthora megakarya]